MMLTINKATKIIGNGPHEKKTLLQKVDLKLQPGEFVTVVGGNGAGKSTLFNCISGSLPLTSGQILINDQDVTQLSEEKRAVYLSRVFQDPKMGTAPRMTVAENLLLAQRRGQKRNLHLRQLQAQKDVYYQLCQEVGNGLEQHLDTPTGNLSGGQRQLLLLDEHTAALDPKTSKQLMQITADRVEQQQLTCLMITHRMEDALKYGNRLILLRKGQIVKDLSAAEKAQLRLQDLLLFFEDDL